MGNTAKRISSAICCALTAALLGTLSAETAAGTEVCRLGSPTIKAQAFEEYGAVPAGSAAFSEKERPMLIPCGTPFGIKLRSEGVMVIAVNENSPAAESGIKKGDIITAVNGTEITCNSDISEALLPDSEILLRRGDSELCLSCAPNDDPDGRLYIGVWVRDSAAGIGTLTYFDPETGKFGGLGHAVSDITTGDLVPLSSGEITDADIYDVIQSKQGEAGELCGALLPNSTAGVLSANTRVGVFGSLTKIPSGTPLPMAFRQEVHTGKAHILSTISGTTPRAYSIEIERINLFGMGGSKGMVIRITDPELISETGGIVRGMSGSPIIQDGRLVGAVTHVLINDPQRGYAVFAESMVEASRE